MRKPTLRAICTPFATHRTIYHIVRADRCWHLGMGQEAAGKVWVPTSELLINNALLVLLPLSSEFHKVREEIPAVVSILVSIRVSVWSGTGLVSDSALVVRNIELGPSVTQSTDEADDANLCSTQSFAFYYSSKTIPLTEHLPTLQQTSHHIGLSRPTYTTSLC